MEEVRIGDCAALQFLAITPSDHYSRSRVACCYTDGTVLVWKADTGAERVGTIKVPGTSAVSFAGTNSLVLGFSNGNVAIYDFSPEDGVSRGNSCIPRTPFEGHIGVVHALACSPRGVYFISCFRRQIIDNLGHREGRKTSQTVRSYWSCACRCLVRQREVHRVRI